MITKQMFAKLVVTKFVALVMHHELPRLTEKALTELEMQERFLEEADPSIEAYAELLIQRFDEMEKDVLAKLKSPGKKYYHHENEAWVEKAEFNVDKWLFSQQKFYGTLSADNGLLTAGLIPRAGQQSLDDLALGMSFNQLDKVALTFIATNAKNAGWSITNTQYERLRKQLMEGVAQGESIPHLRARVMTAMQVARDRATLIARTEVLKASNRGSLIAMAQRGVVEGKQWLATMDKRTCPSCESMDGATMPLDKSYYEQGEVAVIGGIEHKFDYEEIQHPPLHPDCRCTLLAIIKQGAYKCAGKKAFFLMRAGFSVGGSVPCKLKDKGARAHVGEPMPFQEGWARKQLMDDYKAYYGKPMTNLEANEFMNVMLRYTGNQSSNIRAAQSGWMEWSGWHGNMTEYMKFKEIGNKLEQIFNFSPRWVSHKPLFRGLSAGRAQDEALLEFLKTAKVGQTMKINSTQHWSSSATIADHFNGRVVFKLLGSAEKSTAISHMSSFVSEQEVIISRDTVYQIAKITKKPPVYGRGEGRYIIELVEKTGGK